MCGTGVVSRNVQYDQTLVLFLFRCDDRTVACGVARRRGTRPSRDTTTKMVAQRLAWVPLLIAFALPARADLTPEAPGKVEKLASPTAHWAWVSDLVLERAALLNLDDGRFLGLVNGGYGAIAPMFSRRRAELYLPTTYYSRRSRGQRTDLLEVWDLPTLSPVAEIALPPKRAIDAVALAHSALSDDDRFVAVFNWTPATSLSIVDTDNRTFAGEIAIPGCSLVYPAGPRRFLSLCADGSALLTTLDEGGRELGKARSKPFFDPKSDPVTEKAARFGDTWVFASFEGKVYTVDFSGGQLAFGEPWPLASETEMRAGWRAGGWQHLAIHQSSGRLYVLMHQGKADSHKDAGTEVWVFDLKSRKRLSRIELRNPGVTIYGFPLVAPPDSNWAVRKLVSLVLDNAPAAVTHIQVTQDERPLLITASQWSAGLGLYDAVTGAFSKRVMPTGWTTDLLLAPWGGKGGALMRWETAASAGGGLAPPPAGGEP